MARKVRFHESFMGGHPMDVDGPVDEQDDDDDEVANDRADTIVRRSGKPDPELAELRAEVDRLKRQIPPPEPPRSQAVADEIDEMSEEDFDALLFSNPREALRLNNERVKKELRTEYTTNQGTNNFWKEFYDENKDLKEDDDLVQSTLQKNMGELGNMAVDKAKNRLAELTRDRILGFMKKRKEPRANNRAVTEGANAPSIPHAEPADDGEGKPTTMSDILKGRRAIRRKAAQAA